MKTSTAALKILDQLTQLVNQIRVSDFAAPSESLSKSTIGQHIRHTLEFFICFEKGFENGVINYDKRAHDALIESDKFIAHAAIERVKQFVADINEDQKILLEVGYDLSDESFVTVETNALRELVYNIEHAVHHMAIMKIGIREVAPYVVLPPDFGVAASTVRFRQEGKIAVN